MVLAGLGVGFVVGLTGMGGGALMTPVLMLFFQVPPVAAVSSDLVASAVMKPFGGFVHARRGTVHWPLVRWLCAGSVPAAFLGVLLLRLVGDDASAQRVITVALGVALLLAAAGLVQNGWTARRRVAGPDGPVTVRPLPTLLLGAAGGLVVGLTSVGSGSLIIVALLMLYPALRANDIVGTDLVQAIPLVGAAALGHAFFGDVQLEVTAAVLAGSVPGVLAGARVSSRAPAGVVRAALIVVLLATAHKLLGAPTGWGGAAAAAAALAAALTGLLTRRRTAAPPADLGPADAGPAVSVPVQGARAADEPASARAD